MIIIQEKSGYLVFPFQRKRIKYCLRYKIVILKPVTLCFVSFIIRGNNCMCFSLDYADLCSLGMLKCILLVPNLRPKV